MTRALRRIVAVAVGGVVFATAAAAHGVDAATAGLGFPHVVAASVSASLLGGGVVLGVAGRHTPSLRRVVPCLFLALGGLSVALAVDSTPVGAGLGVGGGVGLIGLARGHAFTDCGACAEAALGAVTLHRGLEGAVLATVYAADATLGLLGAAILTLHAMAETAAIGALYTASRRHAVGAVCLLQIGFVGGVATGWSVVDAVPAVVEAGLLALVGGVLLAVGALEGYLHYADRQSIPAA